VNSLGDGRSGLPSKGALERLSIALSPFILRRTKKQVLKELPDKCEQTLLCELDGAQKKLYDQLRRHYRASIKHDASAKSLGPSEMKVFEALLRLRQVSCHPGLVDQELASGSSTKFDVLLEHLEEIRAAGHKALVFSQFTSLLELLKPHLKNAGIRFEYLDGQTRNRGAAVEKFNSDATTTVFLISLKAGGTGLNLTTASYVFLLDPWWNPAIESQAIDRAYRMGQKQKVMAYRLIAEGTIEEKIMRLQAQKRSLADAVIAEEQSFIRSLSVDDLASLFD
jgi:SNF2 family DNA or RNA helicase